MTTDGWFPLCKTREAHTAGLVRGFRADAAALAMDFFLELKWSLLVT